MTRLRIGVDLGGTKTEALALDADGRELLRERVPTARGYDATIANIKRLVEGVEERLGRQGTVGVGIPGAISPATGLVKNANSIWLIGKPFDRDLSRALGREVRMANDADCFALSEATDGAAAGAASVFGAILGTGVGAGIVVHGRLVEGPNAIAGEWGHNPLPYPAPPESPGPDCYCGRKGCIEMWLSGPGLEADYHRATGREARAADIAASDEPEARAAMERYVDRLARALAGVINILDPHVVVLGGGVSNVASLYREVPRVWGRYVFSDDVATRLVPPRHGDSSGVRGAAWLWSAE